MQHQHPPCPGAGCADFGTAAAALTSREPRHGIVETAHAQGGVVHLEDGGWMFKQLYLDFKQAKRRAKKRDMFMEFGSFIEGTICHDYCNFACNTGTPG